MHAFDANLKVNQCPAGQQRLSFSCNSQPSSAPASSSTTQVVEASSPPPPPPPPHPLPPPPPSSSPSIPIDEANPLSFGEECSLTDESKIVERVEKIISESSAHNKSYDIATPLLGCAIRATVAHAREHSLAHLRPCSSSGRISGLRGPNEVSFGCPVAYSSS